MSQFDTVHDTSRDLRHTCGDGTVITLERSGIAYTVSVLDPGEESWRAKTATYWPMGRGPAGLPENIPGRYNLRCEDDPYDAAKLTFEAMVLEFELASLGLAFI